MATFLRSGLGEGDQALRDTSQYLASYGADHVLRDKAAALALAASEQYERRKDWAGLERHLIRFLSTFPHAPKEAQAATDRRIQALVKLAEVVWRTACPIAGEHGACIETRRTKAWEHGTRVRCATGLAVVVRPRDVSRVSRSRAYLDEALRLAGGSAPGADAASAVAQGKMLRAEAAYERFLAVSVPAGLDFTPRHLAASRRRFKTWFDDKASALEAARREYLEVVNARQAHFAIAAAARIGQLFEEFSGELFTAPLPAAPPAPAGVAHRVWRQTFEDSYCDNIADRTVHLEDKAIDALRHCLSKSTELSWFSEWSELCEAELNQLRPREFPLATEVRAQPTYTAERRMIAERGPLERPQ
jgi:hypothetical protein